MKPATIYTFFMSLFTFISCTTIPQGVTAVSPFSVDKYLGKWYEVARFDHKFERGLINVTAVYSFNADGSIKVQNRGFNKESNEWRESVGVAKFVGDTTVAKLKVSFFGPFYGGYNVIALDSDYQYALVSGPNHNYLWILSRHKTITADIKNKYLKIAEDMGFEVSNLLWVEQN